MNLIRALHLSPQLQAAEEKYIYDVYDYQLYLGLLATYPDWNGHGFGAAKVKWGMQKAKAEKERLSQVEGRQIEIPVTLLATLAGYPLYKSLGFESVAKVTFHLLDKFGGGTTLFEYMRWFTCAHA
jgi:GNAT superfamily N-acetyltransferase